MLKSYTYYVERIYITFIKNQMMKLLGNICFFHTELEQMKS